MFSYVQWVTKVPSSSATPLLNTNILNITHQIQSHISQSILIMPRSGPNHSPHKRTRIATSYFLGKTARRIGAEEGISDRAVYAIVARYRDQKSAQDRPRSGRPSVLTKRDKRHIFILINADPFTQHRELIEEAGLSCSITTITWYLRIEGIEHWTALRRPKLTPEIAKIRLDFVRSYLEKPESFWKV